MTTSAPRVESTQLEPSGGWAQPPEARLVPRPPAERGLLFRALSRGSTFFGRPELPNIFPVLHLHPGLFWSWLVFASRLMPYGSLHARIREKLILRTAWNCRSRYEWGQHVDLALAAGVTDAEIVDVTRGPDVIPDGVERALLSACDELCAESFVRETTWQVLAQRFERSQLVEIVLLVGHYRMLAGFLNTAGLALEAPVEEQLAAFHRRITSRAT